MESLDRLATLEHFADISNRIVADVAQMKKLLKQATPAHVAEMLRCVVAATQELTEDELLEIATDQEFTSWASGYVERRFLRRRDPLRLAIPLESLPAKIEGEYPFPRIREADERVVFEILNRADEATRYERLCQYIEKYSGITSFDLVSSGPVVPGWTEILLVSPVDFCLQQGLDPANWKDYTKAVTPFIQDWLRPNRMYSALEGWVDSWGIDLEEVTCKEWSKLPHLQEKGKPLKIRRMSVIPARFRVGRSLYCLSSDLVPDLIQEMAVDGASRAVASDLLVGLCLTAAEPELLDTADEKPIMNLVFPGTRVSRFGDGDRMLRLGFSLHGTAWGVPIGCTVCGQPVRHACTPVPRDSKDSRRHEIISSSSDFEAKEQAGVLICAVS